MSVCETHPGSSAAVDDVRRHRVVSAVQLAAAVVEGVALSTIVVHATTHLGLVPAAVGVVLAVAGVAALGAAVPLGAVADRIGLRASATIFGVGSAAALAGYAVADSLLGYAVAAICFAVSQAAYRSIRQALAVYAAAPATRLGIRATMHTLLNVGFGLGTVIGGLVTFVGTDVAFRTVYWVAAGIATLTAFATIALPRTAVRRQERASRGVLTALRDRRFAAATLLAAIVQLTMPVLTVLLPVWVLTYTNGPRWVPSAAMALNATMVIGAQRPWAARVVTAFAAARSAQVAAATLLMSCVLMGIAAIDLTPTSASVVVVVAVVFLTIGEVAGGAATWFVALQAVPAETEGRYQSAFTMSSSAARILGSAIALPLVTSVVFGGWVVLGVAMAAACLGVSALASRSMATRVNRVHGEALGRLRDCGVGRDHLLGGDDRRDAPEPGFHPPELGRVVGTVNMFTATPEVDLGSAEPDIALSAQLSGSMMKYDWKINGRPFSDTEPLTIRQGQRASLTFNNMSTMWHPMHLHGHTFRVINRDGSRGVRKDTVIVLPMYRLTIDVIADNPGEWLLYCHNTYHQEAGMMTSLNHAV